MTSQTASVSVLTIMHHIDLSTSHNYHGPVWQTVCTQDSLQFLKSRLSSEHAYLAEDENSDISKVLLLGISFSLTHSWFTVSIVLFIDEEQRS